MKTADQIQRLDSNLPDLLKQQRRFTGWRYGDGPPYPSGRRDKIPIHYLTGHNARIGLPSSLGDFYEVREAFINPQDWPHPLDGLMIALLDKPLPGTNLYLIAIDLDHCVNPESGNLLPWAAEIVDRFETFAEVSPSGRGVHLYLLGDLPRAGMRTGHIEVYKSGRFMTVTGDHVAGTPQTVNKCQDALDELIRIHFPDRNEGHGSFRQMTRRPPMTDEEILLRAKQARNGEKFQRLYGGDTSGYDSPSSADFALVSLLAYWTQNVNQIDRLFRRSGLMRGKWDEKRGTTTYGRMTIENVLARNQDQASRREGSHG